MSPKEGGRDEHGKNAGGVRLGTERFQYHPATTESTAIVANIHPAFLHFPCGGTSDPSPFKAFWFRHLTSEKRAERSELLRTHLERQGWRLRMMAARRDPAVVASVVCWALRAVNNDPRVKRERRREVETFLGVFAFIPVSTHFFRIR